jgi:hypothetical protein
VITVRACPPSTKSKKPRRKFSEIHEPHAYPTPGREGTLRKVSEDVMVGAVFEALQSDLNA